MYLLKTVNEPKFLLLYPPQSFDANLGVVKPEGSLGLLYIAGALRDAGFYAEVLDCCIGNSRYSLDETFFKHTLLSNGRVRIGMSAEAIINEAAEYDVIGISSIFTPQTRMVEELVRIISQAYPEKLIVLGGINARSQMPRFFDAGAHLICISEAEQTIVEIGKILREGGRYFGALPGVAFRHAGRIQVNPPGFIDPDLDKLPMPAWDMLQLKRYWEINRPHNSGLSFDTPPAYAPAMTSRGCVYICDFCHISGEGKDSITGYIGKFRYKSEERVEKEMERLKELGVEYVFIEDDSLLARKKRALGIFRMLIKFGFKLGDVNGVNLSHLHKNQGGRIVPDDEMLETMAAAGFNKLLFPVESGSQRIIDRWASGKISHEKYEIALLIKKAEALGINVASCYLIGYPDETYEELMQTLVCAKRHIDAGSSCVNFTMVTPFPGTALYEYVMQNDLLLPGLELADMTWMRPSMKTIIEPWILEFIQTKAWEFLNKPERVNAVRSFAPKVSE
ncbi:MAG: B12-binding domain-containing radical SAM protein [Candidatus Yanofskybacteria bacterium]|nr:B12-binding domain-containing radical SAM protein [Candidatus Yanofskybacteria bacterium]